MSNKRHILVVSDPPALPGYLPRLRYLCDYFVRKGCALTLVTEQYQPLDFAHDYPIVTIPMYSGSLFDWAIKTIWTLLTDWHNRIFAKRVLSGQYADIQKPDVVLCSAFSDFPLGAAKRIAQFYQVPLICDIRDLDEQIADSRYQYKHRTWWTMCGRRIYRAIHIRRRNNVLRKADSITTVSPWHAEFNNQFNPNTHIVYNGYDAAQFFPGKNKTDKFCISYIGSLFDWQQSALQQVKQALQELDIPITLDIHTPKDRPVAFDQLGDAIRRSSIMLVLTSTNAHGMLTTKFYEALGCDKPILCVPSDNGDLAQLIAYTKAGIATSDKEQIRTFITDKYNEWKQQGYTCQQAIHREEFSRETQCKHLEQIIQSVVEHD